MSNCAMGGRIVYKRPKVLDRYGLAELARDMYRLLDDMQDAHDVDGWLARQMASMDIEARAVRLGLAGGSDCIGGDFKVGGTDE